MEFVRKMRIGDDPEKPYVYPGDPVTDYHRKLLGTARLRNWWASGLLRRSDDGIAPVHRYSITNRGRGHFTLHGPNGDEKIRGKDALNARLAELGVPA